MKIVDQKNLCIFAHYSEYEYFPLYVTTFVNELSMYFDQVILVTNERTIRYNESILDNKVSVFFVRNEGYDFGMFYKVFSTIDTNAFYQIACINDSNVIFNKLTHIFVWAKSVDYDFWGLIDSYEKPWYSTHTDNYHIQSHFIVFNKKAIEELPRFLNSIDIESLFNEKNKTSLWRKVINDWEIGLSQFMAGSGLKLGSYIDSQLLSQKYLSGKSANIGFKLYTELIKSGYPLIKKKIILKKNWRDVFHLRLKWEEMIRRYGNEEWKIDDLIDDLKLIRKDHLNAQK